MDSPFIYGTTVSTDAFTNREDEIKKLAANLQGGINTMLISPRRWGKSSLVEKVINDISKKEKGVKTVVIDLFAVSTEEEFLEIFAREVIKSSSSKVAEWLTAGRDFFKQLVPKLSVGIDPHTDFSLSFDWTELKKHSVEVLELPAMIAAKKNIKFIICLDEFQNLSTFRDFEALEKKLRSVWQRQASVTYCLYGSKRHMMSEIFNTPSKPFYRFGDLMLLEKIQTGKWIPFIVNGFSRTGKKIAKGDAEAIARIMKNHPWYVQQLAHYTWNQTEKVASQSQIHKALAELLNANTPFYQMEIEALSITQLNLLKAIAQGETKLTSVSAARTYHLGTSRNVSKNKSILINRDLINESKGRYEFLDPAFEKWFRRQFFNQDIYEEWR